MSDEVLITAKFSPKTPYLHLCGKSTKRLHLLFVLLILKKSSLEASPPKNRKNDVARRNELCWWWWCKTAKKRGEKCDDDDDDDDGLLWSTKRATFCMHKPLRFGAPGIEGGELNEFKNKVNDKLGR